MFILLIFLLINFFFILNKLRIFSIFLFITLRVSEARIGLSILTILVRRHGNDYMKIIIF
jgi:NADH:ubiquinone oxidoreductase subunit K